MVTYGNLIKHLINNKMDLKHYEQLSKVNTKGLTEEKNGLTYLTWSLAFDELLKQYPDTTYEIVKFDGKPYYLDETGAMVYTNMTIEGITREMWLPVLDGANKPMKKEAYKYTVKNYKTGQQVEKTCQPINMFDINKSIMRCLVKNIAMFGLGLNIYAGEDLPLGDEDIPKEDKKHQETQNNESEKPKKTIDEVLQTLTYEQYNKLSEADKLRIKNAICKKNDLPFINSEEIKQYLK